MKTAATTPDPVALRRRLEALGLHGVLAHFEESQAAPWIPRLLEIEEEERGRRGLERRLRNAKLGRFKLFADFDANWPKKIDHEQLEELFTLGFIEEAANVILVGPNGVGKTMIAKNLAYQAVLRGHTARFVTASELLNDLAAQETGSALSRKLRQYSHWKVLVIDEVGYLAGSARHGDLLFELINRRYQEKPIIMTTNKVFTEWGEVFPSSSSVVTMVDRLIHKAEVLKIEADSYRLKEAKEREADKRAQRRRKHAQRPRGQS
jgi:DNA replication protein DnaC